MPDTAYDAHTNFIFIPENDGVKACLPVFQVSPVATSKPGLTFNALGAVFGPPYIEA